MGHTQMRCPFVLGPGFHSASFNIYCATRGANRNGASIYICMCWEVEYHASGTVTPLCTVHLRIINQETRVQFHLDNVPNCDAIEIGLILAEADWMGRFYTISSLIERMPKDSEINRSTWVNWGCGDIFVSKLNEDCQEYTVILIIIIPSCVLMFHDVLSTDRYESISAKCGGWQCTI